MRSADCRRDLQEDPIASCRAVPVVRQPPQMSASTSHGAGAAQAGAGAETRGAGRSRAVQEPWSGCGAGVLRVRSGAGRAQGAEWSEPGLLQVPVRRWSRRRGRGDAPPLAEGCCRSGDGSGSSGLRTSCHASRSERIDGRQDRRPQVVGREAIERRQRVGGAMGCLNSSTYTTRWMVSDERGRRGQVRLLLIRSPVRRQLRDRDGRQESDVARPVARMRPAAATWVDDCRTVERSCGDRLPALSPSRLHRDQSDDVRWSDRRVHRVKECPGAGGAIAEPAGGAGGAGGAAGTRDAGGAADPPRFPRRASRANCCSLRSVGAMLPVVATWATGTASGVAPGGGGGIVAATNAGGGGGGGVTAGAGDDGRAAEGLRLLRRASRASCSSFNSVVIAYPLSVPEPWVLASLWDRWPHRGRGSRWRCGRRGGLRCLGFVFGLRSRSRSRGRRSGPRRGRGCRYWCRFGVFEGCLDFGHDRIGRRVVSGRRLRIAGLRCGGRRRTRGMPGNIRRRCGRCVERNHCRIDCDRRRRRVDDDVVVDDLDLLATDHSGVASHEQATPAVRRRHRQHQVVVADYVRNSEAALHTVTLPSSFRNDTS